MKKTLAFAILAAFCALSISALPPIQTAIPGMILWWPLNEGAGITVNNYMGNFGIGTFSGSPSWTTGITGTALTGFSSSSFVNFGNTSIVTNQESFTVSAWIRPSSVPSTYAAVIDNAFLGSNGWGMALTTNKPYIGCNTGYAVSTTSLALNQWYHIVGEVTWTGSLYSFAIFVDGTNATGTHPTATTWNTNALTRLGQAVKTTTYAFPGIIDDVRVYNRLLTTNEIVALYGGGYGKAGP